MQYLVGFLSYIDANLIGMLKFHHMLAYISFFLVIFFETGILFAALLPGDSLIIACGTLAASKPEALNIHLLFFLLLSAVVAGNMLNYITGKWFGSKLFSSRMMATVNIKYFERAKVSYQIHGGKVIIVASFIPLLRTFVPFIAGVAEMPIRSFFIYSWIGGLLWVGTLLYGSYLIDSMPVIKDHLTIIIVIIFIVAVCAPVIQYFKRK